MSLWHAGGGGIRSRSSTQVVLFGSLSPKGLSMATRWNHRSPKSRLSSRFSDQPLTTCVKENGESRLFQGRLLSQACLSILLRRAPLLYDGSCVSPFWVSSSTMQKVGAHPGANRKRGKRNAIPVRRLFAARATIFCGSPTTFGRTDTRKMLMAVGTERFDYHVDLSFLCCILEL